MAAKKLFDPKSDKPFALSRSKVELFMDCPRCFYLDRRLGIARPARCSRPSSTSIERRAL